ncbi:toxin-antitoxin system YwqK family antitoxin [Polaribacter sp. NJDZ03]|uniref:toxin-antitoxin system YwqK family antitoxin n=1 Tax=Polaribacter sp. NJDZ03 TaxID=2855841 RepID=UPI001C49D5E1|nr:toxin-antitoxin system YwqK family antitoxin [Polaribacter sp. NJDZ03]
MIKIKRLFFILLFFACFFTSENFNAQKINQLNANNERVGVWKKYYSNKRIRYVGQFKNGKEVGVFKFYDITSSAHPVIIKTFYKNSDSLYVKFFTLKGKIETEGVLKGKDRVGNWKYFYPDGIIMSEENYKKGKLHGAQIIYYQDGQVTEFSNYKNGLLDGVKTTYASNGVLIEELTYKNGELTGLAKYFELDGKLLETGNYKNGIRVGNWEYYLDGEVATEKELRQKSTFSRKKED